MTIRRLIFWLHLSIGLTVGLVVAFLAITGSIMAFQPQIIAFAERSSLIVTPAPADACVAPSSLLAVAAAQQHRVPASLSLFADPHRPAEVSFGRDATLLLNPCTGAILSTRAGRLRGFFSDVTALHHFVQINGVRHENLRALKNIAVCGFVLMLLSGLVLWFPRKLRWQNIKPTVLIRSYLRGRARDWNLHNVAGIWLVIPLLTISGCGLIMAYPWANSLLNRAAGTPLLTPAAPRPEQPRQAPKPLDPTQFSTLDPAISKARALDPRYVSLVTRIPNQTDRAISFTLDESRGGHPASRSQLSINRKDASIATWDKYADATRGRRWRMNVRYLHTGEFFGPLGQVIAFLATLGALTLVYTGFSMAIRRLRASQNKRRVQASKRRTETVSA